MSARKESLHTVTCSLLTAGAIEPEGLSCGLSLSFDLQGFKEESHELKLKNVLFTCVLPSLLGFREMYFIEVGCLDARY